MLCIFRVLLVLCVYGVCIYMHSVQAHKCIFAAYVHLNCSWFMVNDWLLYPPSHCECEWIQWNIYVLNIRYDNNIEWLQYWIVGVSSTVSVHALCFVLHERNCVVCLFLSFFFISPYFFLPAILFAFRFGKIARIIRITQNIHYTALMGNSTLYSRNKYMMPLYICTWIRSTMSKSLQGARIEPTTICTTLNQMAFDWFWIRWLILWFCARQYYTTRLYV